MCRLNSVGVEKWMKMDRRGSFCEEKWGKKKWVGVDPSAKKRDTKQTTRPEELKEPFLLFSANTPYFYFLVNYIKTRQEFVLDTVQIKNNAFGTLPLKRQPLSTKSLKKFKFIKIKS